MLVYGQPGDGLGVHISYSVFNFGPAYRYRIFALGASLAYPIS